MIAQAKPSTGVAFKLSIKVLTDVLSDFAMNLEHELPQLKRAEWTSDRLTPAAGWENSKLMHTTDTKFIVDVPSQDNRGKSRRWP
jgi:hypothetical protein